MKKSPKTLLFSVLGQEQVNEQANPKLLRVLLNDQTTRLDFGYVATNYYVKGGWITISPDTYLQIQGAPKRYLLKEAEGIALAPEKLNFESNKDYQFFSLYFEALPLGNLVFDMIENYLGTENDFNYYGIELRLKDAVEVG